MIIVYWSWSLVAGSNIVFGFEETDANGSLTKDKNRRIDSIYYDNSGNLQRIRFCRVPNEGLTHTERENDVTYIYTTDGQKLNTSYQTTNFAGTYPLSMTAASTDYVGNLLLKNGHPEMLRLDDGYVSFDSDTISGIHYYIQDYMGNNRVVVNGRTDSIEQVTHYYPYGGVIGDISTDESLQKFKFEDKELDRTFGLDNYDIHARQYFAMAPMWDRPDPLANDFPGISPYAYCGGDPVNRVDYDGRDWITATYGNHTFYCWDDQVHSQEDVTNRYYYGDDVNEQKIQYVGTSGLGNHNGATIVLNDDGSYSISGNNAITEETNDKGLHIGSLPQGTTPSGNYYGNYLGSDNPGKGESYCTPPIDGTDFAAFCHDLGYDKVSASGLSGVFLTISTLDADAKLSLHCALENFEIKSMIPTERTAKRNLYNTGASVLFMGTSIVKSLLVLLTAPDPNNPLKY